MQSEGQPGRCQLALPVSSTYHRSLTNTIAQSHDAKMVSMTWSLQLLVALVAVVTSSMVVQCAAAAVGEIAHVVIFNKNQVRSDMSCTDAEFALIRDTIVQAASSKRRGLTTLGRGTRGQVASSLPAATATATATATDSSSRRRRRVQTKCSNCGPYCGAGGTGCPGKGGRRRRRRQLTNNNSSPLLTMATCQGKIPAVDDALKALERSLTSLSASCRKLVGSSRDISCHEFTNDCGVSYVSLMDARKAVLVPKLPPTGTVFCQSTKVSFLATTSFWLGEVNFDLKSSSSSSTNGGVSEQHSQDEAPYYMDGDSGQDYKAGNYTLTVSSQYMANQAQTIQFRVNPC
jgi:hypothetical protein